MPGRFFDTNVLLYLASAQTEKADRAEQLLRDGGMVSVQVLNEFANVARRKMALSRIETRSLLASIRGLVDITPVTVEVHDTGLALAELYGLSVYDALIAAAALIGDCDVLWSEDMRHGLRIDRRLQVVNPFIQA